MHAGSAVPAPATGVQRAVSLQAGQGIGTGTVSAAAGDMLVATGDAFVATGDAFVAAAGEAFMASGDGMGVRRLSEGSALPCAACNGSDAVALQLLTRAAQPASQSTC